MHKRSEPHRRKNEIRMEKTTLSNGKAIAQACFTEIESKGKKFKQRNVPIYIRKHLWFPWYIAGEYIHIIQLPDHVNDKVHFKALLIDEPT